MSLPKSVQAQLEAAEAILAQQAQAAPAQEPEANAQPEQEQPQESVVEQATNPVEAKPVEAKPAETKSDEATWEQRYKSLQGLFNARVNELQVSNKQLAQQVQQLTEKLNQVTDTLAKKPELAAAAVDPKDVEEFGQDLVGMVQRQVAAAVSGLLAKFDSIAQGFEKRLADVEKQLGGATQTAAMTAEQLFFVNLSKAVPDWEQINADERFLAWLGEADPVYGLPRQAALDAAHQVFDVSRVASIFNAFKSQFAAAKPEQTRTNVDKQVSPSKVATQPTVTADKPIITQAQIQAFYKDVATGKYRGRDAEAAKMERIINEAIAEGRVR